MTVAQFITEIMQKIPSKLQEDVVNVRMWLVNGRRAASQEHAWTFLRQRVTQTLPATPLPGMTAGILTCPGEPVDPTGRLTVSLNNYQVTIPIVSIDVAQNNWADTDKGQPQVAVLEQQGTSVDPGGKTFQFHFFPPNPDIDYSITTDGYFYLGPYPDDNGEDRWLLDYPDLMRLYVMYEARMHKGDLERAMGYRHLYDTLLMQKIDHDMLRNFEINTSLRPTVDGVYQATGQMVDVWGRGRQI